MSRTIRRTEKHLLKWWLPELEVVVRSKHPWRQQRLPGLLYSKQETQIVRTLQTDKHRFFAGPGVFSRNRWQRKFRQASRMQLHHAKLIEDWDDVAVPLIYYPYMFWTRLEEKPHGFSSSSNPEVDVNKFILLFLLLCLTGCDTQYDRKMNAAYQAEQLRIARSQVDQCLARDLFKECLAGVPKGPTATKYNDWDEMIEECRVTAKQFATKPPELIQPACKEN